MIKFILSLVLFLCVQGQAQAQIASASLFGNMKNINPAVISKRQAGQYTFIAEMISAEKTQTLDSGTKGEAEITSQDFNFFRGGKGGGFTTELFIKSAAGEMERVDKATDGSTETADADVGSTLIKYAMSFGNLGVGLTYSKFTNTTTGTLTQLNTDQTNTAMGLSVGMAIDIGLDLAIYGEFFNVSTDYNFAVGDGAGGATADQGTAGGSAIQIGAGLGFSGKSSHFEVALEKPLGPVSVKTDDGQLKEVQAMRLSGTAEFRLGGIRLGYTGRAYINGYFDQEKQLYNSLIFLASEDVRLEHNVNLSLGGDKGLSISGGFSMSEIENKEPITLTEPISYPTTTKLMVISANVGYAF